MGDFRVEKGARIGKKGKETIIYANEKQKGDMKRYDFL